MEIIFSLFCFVFFTSFFAKTRAAAAVIACTTHRSLERRSQLLCVTTQSCWFHAQKINRIQCIEDSCVEKGPYPLPSRDKRAGSAAAAHSTRLLDHLEHCLENDVKFFYISYFGLVTKAGRQIVVQQISGTRHQLLVLSELGLGYSMQI